MAQRMIRDVEVHIGGLRQSLQRAYLAQSLAKEQVWAVVETAKLNSPEWNAAIGALDIAEKDIASFKRLIANRERKIRNLEPIAYPAGREAAV